MSIISRVVILFSLLICIFSSKTFGQNSILFSGNHSELVFTNPAFAGSKNSLVLSSNYHNQINSGLLYHGIRAEVDGQIYSINSSYGLTFSSNFDNAFNKSSQYGGMYAYILPVTRKLYLKPAINLNYIHKNTNYSLFTNRLDLSSSGDFVNNLAVKSDYFNLGLGLLLFTERYYFGFSADHINKPVESSLLDQNFKLPIKYSTIVGASYRLGNGTIKPIILYQYQDEKFMSNSSQENLIDPLHSLTVFAKYENRSMTTGLGYTYVHNSFSSYHAQIGYRSYNFEAIYDFGLAPFNDISGTNDIAFFNQISIYYRFATASINAKYSIASCPSFGSSSGGRYRSVSRLSGQGNNNYVSSSNGNNNKVKAGTLTAGEVNDFSKWDLWTDLSKDELENHRKNWKISPLERYAVQLINKDKKVVIDANVKLCTKKGEVIWESKTDNTGNVNLWVNLYEEDEIPAFIEVKINNEKYTFQNIVKFNNGINILEVPVVCEVPEKIEILFVVDATGSMGDEIDYLKAELENVILSVQDKVGSSDINLGSLFYRCKGNSYTTRKSKFSGNFDNTIKFVNKQQAGEGGDEAVEIALKESINDFDWSPNANSRIIFLILDEAPSISDDNIKTIQKAVKEASVKGIKIIPVVASGLSYDQDKSLEYLMRSIALATSGTYVCLTDHSGVGSSHTDPSVDEFDAEFLNKLFLRLIYQYSYMNSCDTDYSDLMKEITDTTLVEIIEHVVLDSTFIEECPEDSIDSVYISTPREIIEDNTETETNNEYEENVFDEQVSITSSSFTFYPNPTTGQVTIDIEGNINELFLCDQSCRILERYDTKDKQTLTINIEKYANGMYYLRYINEKTNYSGKLLLIH